jgi:DNA repair protein RecN (Recombination protein N)
VLRNLRIENLVLIQAAELDLSAGLNALTGETGAGKTIFAQAIGLLLGTKGDAGLVGPAGKEAYVEAEFEVPAGFWDDEERAGLAELRPDDEESLVLARRVFGDGRTRAYAWGRAIAREDLAEAAERLIAMSGQFEQRRLARPAFQLDTLDDFLGSEQNERRSSARAAWRDLTTATRRLGELERDSGTEEVRLAELRTLVSDTEGLTKGLDETLRSERARLRSVGELVEGTTAATRALDPDEGDGAASLADQAGRAIAPLESLSPELRAVGDELRELSVRLAEVTRELHGLVGSFESDPGRLEEVETQLDRIATARRRHDAATLEELLARRDVALAELAEREDGRDPVEHAREQVAAAEARYGAVAEALRGARREGAPRLAEAVAAELRDVGMAEGEFAVEVLERGPGPTGGDAVVLSIRPNPGLPFGAVAETASGGELSRIALALAAVAGGETIVFDEIDAGIGGVTAHGVAEVLRRLATRAQVLTITHLPQIASVADTHFLVEKVPGDPTHTQIKRLDDPQKRDELERMLGGGAFVTALTSAES